MARALSRRSPLSLMGGERRLQGNDGDTFPFRTPPSPSNEPPAHEGADVATQNTRSTGRLHDVDSAAEYLRCGRRLIYRLVAERKVRFTYAGRSLRFWQSDLDAYLNARVVEPSDSTAVPR
jgi:excisionase family DNA binding protein